MHIPTPVGAVSAEDKPWLLWGGIAAIVLAIGYIVIIPLFAHVGAPPIGGQAFFKYLPGKTAIWWVILWISVFTDLLYIPVAQALYLALKAVNRNAMILAAVFMGMFVVLDLAITWAHYASILSLYHSYAAVGDDAHRATYLAAAESAAAVLATRMEIVYAIVTPSTGVLIAGIVMLKSPFNRTTACLGVVTGVLGILSLTGYDPVIIGNALFATVWFFFAGFRLIRLARA
jgi:hypothetical protein